MLKFYVRHGMVVRKFYEIISNKQSKCLEKFNNFNTQKRKKTNNEFEKDFHKLFNNAFYGKTMEKVPNRTRLDFFKKGDNKNIFKQQPNITFHGIHKSYENCNSYTFKQNEVLMDKPIYLGFGILDLRKLNMHGTYYDNIQPYFWQENLQCLYMDSVTKDTPTTVKETEIFKTLRIDEIVIEESWYVADNIVSSWGYQKFADCNGIQIWTGDGWKKN